MVVKSCPRLLTFSDSWSAEPHGESAGGVGPLKAGDEGFSGFGPFRLNFQGQAYANISEDGAKRESSFSTVDIR